MDWLPGVTSDRQETFASPELIFADLVASEALLQARHCRAAFLRGSANQFATGPRNYHPDGPKVGHALTIAMDQSMGLIKLFDLIVETTMIAA